MIDELEYETVDTAQLSPRIIHAQYYDSSFISKELIPIPPIGGRCVCDYEMVLILYSSGAVNIVNGIEYIFEYGDLIFRRPHTLYTGYLRQRNYSIRFDLKGNINTDPPDYIKTYIKPHQKILTGNITDSFPYRFKTINTESYIKIFEKIFHLFTSNIPARHARIKSLILELICILYDEIQLSQKVPNHFQQSHKNAIIEAINYMEKNVLKNINLADIAKNCGYCPNYFDSLFKEAIKTTPMEYLNNLRVEKCKEILLTYNGTINEVSDICGFNSASYFSYFFKNKTGLSPYAYRKSRIENSDSNLII